MQAELAIGGLRIGVPIVIGGIVGGVGLYIAVDAVCTSFRENPWISGVVGALAGAGGGFFISQLVK